MIVGTRKMVEAADAPFVVVDTTGLIEGVGRALKAYQIESIRPDAIVCIEHRGELGPLIRSQRTHNIPRIAASPGAVSKSREERIAARQRSFKTESVSLFTPAPAEKISVIQGGDLYLDRHGNERGKASWTMGWGLESGKIVPQGEIEHVSQNKPGDGSARGWLQKDRAWGRPVDVLVMPDGALLVSDDRAGAIYRIRYETE